MADKTCYNRIAVVAKVGIAQMVSLPAISYLEDHSFTPDASPVIARIDFLRVTQMTFYTCSGVISWTWSGPVGLRITTVLALVIVVLRAALVWPLTSRAERHGRYVTPVTCYTCNAMIVWTWYGPVGFRIPALFDLGDHSFAFRPSMATYELFWVTWQKCYAGNDVIVQMRCGPNGITASYLNDHRFTPCALAVVVRTDIVAK